VTARLRFSVIAGRIPRDSGVLAHGVRGLTRGTGVVADAMHGVAAVIAEPNPQAIRAQVMPDITKARHLNPQRRALGYHGPRASLAGHARHRAAAARPKVPVAATRTRDLEPWSGFVAAGIRPGDRGGLDVADPV
jgi:hypothetical protein